MSNFVFLQSEWSMLFESASRAEGTANSDARTACFYARRTLELAVAWLYRHDETLKFPYQDSLSALIHEPSFKALVGDALFTKARLIKDLGNIAVHSTKKVSYSDAQHAVRELFHLCYWLARTYGRIKRPAPGLTFSLGLLPPASGAPTQTQAQLQKLEGELKEKDDKLSEALATNATLAEELRKLQAEVAAAKAANDAEPDTHDYSEAETRKAFIDLLLKEAGWDLDPAKNFEVEVSGMPNGGGVGYADYVLWGDNGKPLAVIEAKRTSVNPNNGKQQVKLYADCLEQMTGQRPVMFYTNGYENWIWDDLSYAPRAVQGFYKKAELELLIQRRNSRKKLSEAIINEGIVERYYQKRAIRRVGECFEHNNQRKALLVMATGAGKTRTVIALADLLMRCNWVKRVLFLADRVALVNQAASAFKMHLPNAAPVNLVTEKSTEGRVYVCTYPTMMGLIDDFDGQRRFGVGHFDLIVVDEAHRSIYQKYGAIFDYFDAMLVGLTATPKNEIDKNTYSLFGLETGVPTDAYTLDEAVADGHLVPPVPISVPLKFMREGVKYDDLTDQEKEEWDALDWNEDGTTPSEVDSAALNQWLFNQDTVDKVLEHLMTHGIKVAGNDRLGKSIVFAKNNAHAEFIENRFNESYPEYKGHFARVITYQTKYAQSVIDDFSKKEKMPHIAISVDMLDTGIDVPEVVNLVFFKMVRAKTKFWQMVGRGTRLCPHLFGPDNHKKNFFIFDYCQNLEFFSQDQNYSEGSTAESLSTRLFKTRLDLIAELDKNLASAPGGAEPPASNGCQKDHIQLRQGLAGLLHQTVTAMNVNNFVVRPKRQWVEKFAKPDAWSQQLGPEAFYELGHYIAGLPSELIDEDEEAKRFDMLMLRTQLAVLQAKPDFASFKERIVSLAIALEALHGNIPAVRQEIVLIQALVSDEWWEGVTVSMLETVRKKLRALIKLIPKGEKKQVYTNFEDTLGEHRVIDLPQVTAGLNMAKFKEKARQFLKAHESHLALQRLKRNQPLTPADLSELERMLLEAGGSPELINEVKEKSHGLGLFIRSLVGLDREAAKQAFSEFISGTTAAADQIEFINLIVEELTLRGFMAPERLFEAPFTNLSARGPLGVFPAPQVKQMVQVLNDIRARAAA